MRWLSFRLDGPSSRTVQRLRRPPPHPALILTAAAAALYAGGHPGQISLTGPRDGASTSDGIVTVSGRVEDPGLDRITLEVNGSSRTVPVAAGGFQAQVPLISGENVIRAAPEGALGHLFGASNAVAITAAIPRADVWSVLTWDGPGDIDLHLVMPGGEECDYRNRQSRLGATLDIDNTRGYGPEHIVMTKAVAGTYRLSVHYFAAAGEPSRPVPWQVVLRLKDGPAREYSGVLASPKDQSVVESFKL